MLGAHFHTTNRSELRRRLGSGLIVISGNGPMQRSSDTAYTFRQDSNFLYLTGLSEPNLVLAIDAESEEEFVILPKQTDVERDFGGEINCDKVAQMSGVRTVLQSTEGWHLLKKMLQRRKIVHTLAAFPTEYTRQERMYTSPARRLLRAKLRRSGAQLVDCNLEIARMRMVKRPEELTALKHAVEITALGFSSAKKVLTPGVRDYEIRAELDYEFAKAGAEHGFAPPIIAIGQDATVLHAPPSGRSVSKGDLVLFDIGAEYRGYTADIARTFKVGDSMSEREHQIFESLQRVTNYVQSSVKAGTTWREYVLGSDEVMGEELIKLGVISQNKRELVRPYFPHSVGHSLGLDVHDPCDYEVIHEGMVITSEPGIYLPAEGIGMRIEDDLLVTKAGTENLTSAIAYS